MAIKTSKIKKYKTSLADDRILDFLSNIQEEGVIVIDDISKTIRLDTAKETFFPTAYSSPKFLYFNFSAPCHYEQKKEIDEKSIGDYFSGVVNLEYNFLIKPFEDYITNFQIPELNLPNFYDTVNKQLIKTRTVNFDSVDFFEEELPTKYPAIKNPADQDATIFLDNQLSETLFQVTNQSSLGKYFKTYNPFKEQFPFYAEIIFDNHQRVQSPPFTVNITPNIQQPQSFTPHGFTKPNEFVINSTFETAKNKKIKGIADVLGESNLYSRLFGYYHSKKSDNFSIGLKDFDKENFVPNSLSTLDLLDFFSRVSFSYKDKAIQYLNQLIELNNITYNKILKNTECYAETIGYKITKYNTQGNTPLQEIYIPITGEEKTEFIDTQIKYGNTYRYKISMLRAVIGCEYNYVTNTSVTSKEEKYVINPKIYLFEIDSFEYQNILLDYPPIEPEVEIIPFIGVSNKVKINLNTAVGKKAEKPKILNASENDRYRLISLAQDRKDDKIIFQSDEPSDYFEAFRTEDLPKSYDDFKKAGVVKYKVENNDSSAGSFMDTIQQNKRYYYTFRSVDYHKNISNPTVVYSIEIANDNGTIFPLINTVQFDGDNLKTNNKEFRRFLSITPSLGNTLISLEKNDNFKNLTTARAILDKAVVGINKEGVWNKKFKVRINSLSTGRKIDINLVFNIDKKEQ